MPKSKKRTKNRNHSLASSRSKSSKGKTVSKGGNNLEQLFGQVKKIDAATNFKLRAAALKEIAYIR